MGDGREPLRVNMLTFLGILVLLSGVFRYIRLQQPLNFQVDAGITEDYDFNGRKLVEPMNEMKPAQSIMLNSSTKARRLRRNITAINLRSRKAQIIAAMQKLKPTNDSMLRVRKLVDRLNSDVVILSAATFTYRELAFNWIKTLENLNITNYGILCFDRKVFGMLGPAHGVLMANAARNYSDSDGSITAANNIKKARDILEKARRKKVLEDEKKTGNATDSSEARHGYMKAEEKWQAAKKRDRERKIKKKKLKASPFDPYESLKRRRLSSRRLALQGLPLYDMAAYRLHVSTASKGADKSRNQHRSSSKPVPDQRGGERDADGGVDGPRPDAVAPPDDFKSSAWKSPPSSPNLSSSSSSSQRRQRMLERRSKNAKVSATSPHYTSYQMAKYDAIYHVLLLNKSVIWSDTDAVWVNSCAYDTLLSMPAHVDVAGQRALFPTTLSLITGATLCGGFFMIRPSTAALALIDAVRVMLLSNEDDQAALNKALMDFHAFDFGSEVVLEVPPTGVPDLHVSSSTGEGTFRRRKKASYESSREIAYTRVQKRKNVGARSSLTSGSSSNIPHTSAPATVHSITLALLPYSAFPRGLVDIPVTQSMTSSEKKAYRMARARNGTAKALWQNRTVHPPESPLNPLAIEWRKHSHEACLWHLIADKQSATKIATMKRDLVWYLNESSGWPYPPNSTYSEKFVHTFLYGPRPLLAE